MADLEGMRELYNWMYERQKKRFDKWKIWYEKEQSKPIVYDTSTR